MAYLKQALRRYTLELLHILSNHDANKWARYLQAIPHCDATPYPTQNLPASLTDRRYYRPGNQGYEARVQERMRRWRNAANSNSANK